MSTQHGKIDRRTLLKLIGSAGATATVVSAAGCQSALQNVSADLNAASLTGGKWDDIRNRCKAALEIVAKARAKK